MDHIPQYCINLLHDEPARLADESHSSFVSRQCLIRVANASSLLITFFSSRTGLLLLFGMLAFIIWLYIKI